MIVRGTVSGQLSSPANTADLAKDCSLRWALSCVSSVHDPTAGNPTQPACTDSLEPVPDLLRTPVPVPRHVPAVRPAGGYRRGHWLARLVVRGYPINHPHLDHPWTVHAFSGFHRFRRDGRRVLHPAFSARVLADQQRR